MRRSDRLASRRDDGHVRAPKPTVRTKGLAMRSSGRLASTRRRRRRNGSRGGHGTHTHHRDGRGFSREPLPRITRPDRWFQKKGSPRSGLFRLGFGWGDSRHVARSEGATQAGRLPLAAKRTAPVPRSAGQPPRRRRVAAPLSPLRGRHHRAPRRLDRPRRPRRTPSPRSVRSPKPNARTRTLVQFEGLLPSLSLVPSLSPLLPLLAIRTSRHITLRYIA